jgi:predicted Zn-dependent peptidase
MRRCIVLAFLIALASPLAAQTFDYALPIEEHVFDNGLRLLVLHREGDRRVAAKIFTDFGALVEEPGELGSAHFLEHLLFKGTPTLGTTDWEAERPLIHEIRATELKLEEALNADRNTIRERGVWGDYAHARSTPRIDSLRGEIARLEAEVAAYRDNGSMMRWYQAFGGTNLTATTEQEYMKFDINLPAERVDLFLRVEADRMRNDVFREFDRERMILVEQRLGDLNRPSTPYYEQMAGLVGMVHPVFWPEGYPTDFSQYSRWYQRDLYDRYFQPNNTTLVFVGGVTLEEMIPKVDRYFGWMKRAPEPTRARAIEPPPASERSLTYRSDELSPRVEARHMIPGVGHPDRPHFEVAGEVLQLRLERALSEAGIPGSVNVNTRVIHTARFGVPGSINVEVVTAEANLSAAQTLIEAAVGTLGTGPMTEEDLRLAKKRLRTQWARTLRNPDQLAFEIGHFQTMDRWQTLVPYLEARETTTASDLQRLAAEYFVPENRAWGLVRPKTTTRPISQEDDR